MYMTCWYNEQYVKHIPASHGVAASHRVPACIYIYMLLYTVCKYVYVVYVYIYITSQYIGQTHVYIYIHTPLFEVHKSKGMQTPSGSMATQLYF